MKWKKVLGDSWSNVTFSLCITSTIQEKLKENLEINQRSLKGLCLRKQTTFCDATNGFPANWCLRKECRTSILMTRHYPDLGSASIWLCRLWNLLQPIRSTTQIWIVTCHQYGISVLVSQMSIRGETIDGVTKCCTFSQARRALLKVALHYCNY